jgi:hypothetical protein
LYLFIAENKMRFFSFTRIVAVVAILAFFSGCQKNNILRSEKELNEQVIGTWEKAKVSSKEIITENWVFENGLVTRILLTDSTSTNLDRGRYSIDAKLTTAYLTTTEFKKLGDELNQKWTLVELNDDILIIASDGTQGGGLLTLEFSKKK